MILTLIIYYIVGFLISTLVVAQANYRYSELKLCDYKTDAWINMFVVSIYWIFFLAVVIVILIMHSLQSIISLLQKILDRKVSESPFSRIALTQEEIARIPRQAALLNQRHRDTEGGSLEMYREMLNALDSAEGEAEERENINEANEGVEAYYLDMFNTIIGPIDSIEDVEEKEDMFIIGFNPMKKVIDE
jgi:hypothetical protein